MLTAYRIQALLRTQPLERLYVGESTEDPSRRVLIRRLLPGAPDEEKAETATVFQQHLDRLAQLTHPDTLPVHEFSCGEAGPFVLATDVPTGVTAAELIESHGPLSSRQAASLGYAIATRLFHAHELSIIHGALHPGSVLVNGQGNVVLMDLGLAPMLLDRLSARLQRFPAAWNAVFPTPGAVSPEVLKGETPSVQTDVYGLGVLLYTLLTGRTPFEGTAVLAQNAILLGTVPIQTADAVPDVDVTLAGIVDRCLERDPSRRPADLSEIIAALETLADPMSTALDTLQSHVHNKPYVDRFESRLRVVDAAASSADLSEPPSGADLFSHPPVLQRLDPSVERRHRALLRGGVVAPTDARAAAPVHTNDRREQRPRRRSPWTGALPNSPRRGDGRHRRRGRGDDSVAVLDGRHARSIPAVHAPRSGGVVSC